MKTLLLFLISLTAFAQTDLPGPLSALPALDHMSSKPICSWNATQTKMACFQSAYALTNNQTIVANDTGYTFDNSINLNADTFVLADYIHPFLEATAQTYLTTAPGGGDFGEFNLSDLFYNIGGVNTVILSSTGTLQLSSLASGGVLTTCSSSIGILFTSNSCSPYLDSSIVVENSSDHTKTLQFVLSGLTTGQAAVLKPQFFSGGYIVAAQDHDNNFGTQTFSTANISLANITTGEISTILSPVGDQTLNLGDSSHRWLSVYTDNVFNNTSNPLVLEQFGTSGINMVVTGGFPINFSVNGSTRMSIGTTGLLTLSSYGNGCLKIVSGIVSVGATGTC